MNQSEWEELLSLRAEMNNGMTGLSTVHQERFTELLVKSLRGKGDHDCWLKGAQDEH